MKQLFFTILALLILNSTYGQVKATSAEINAGTDDAKFATALALQGSKYLDQNGAKLSAVTAAGANTYTASIAPAITAYSLGQVFYIKITTANTGASTLNLNGLGAKTFVKDANTALAAGDLLANKVYAVYYDGTNFQILNIATSTNSQTLSLGAAAGNIAINGANGNNVTLYSLGQIAIPGANSLFGPGFTSEVYGEGSTNYPPSSVYGGGFTFTRDNATALGRMDFRKDITGSEDVYFRTGSSATSFNPWRIIASKEWATSQFYNQIQSNNRFFGNGSTTGAVLISESGLNVNNLTLSNTAYVSSATNTPIGSGGIVTTALDGTVGGSGLQTFTYAGGEDSYWFRKKLSGTWGSWFQIASRDWVSATSYNKIESNNRFLPTSIYSYPNGAFIQTDIALPGVAMFTLHIKGNAYGNGNAFSIDLQGYNYDPNDAILNSRAVSTGISTTVDVFVYNGNICFWIPQTGQAQTLIASVYRSNVTGGSQTGNRITSITNAPKPTTGVTRSLTITPAVSYTDTDPIAKYALGSNVAITNTDNIAGAFGKVQAQINAANGAYLPLTGGALTSNVNAKLVLKKTGASQANYMAFLNASNVTEGYVGLGSTANSHFNVIAGVGSNLIMGSNNAAKLTLTQTDIQSSVNITAPGIGIGTSNLQNYKLAVGGGIIAESVKVKPQGSWPDYVFEKDYPILPLNELELFVLKNKHLPNIPNAAEVKKEGIELGEMNVKLLRKIEELTLYIIDQQKSMTDQQKEIEDLRGKVNEMTKLSEVVEKLSAKINLIKNK